jgi:hypothetical protein
VVVFVVHNERIKLMATWFNALATALIAAGFFGPLAALVYQVVPLNIGAVYLMGIAFGCFVLGIAIHLVGRAVLGRLRE